jgi:hypothetical protein
MSGSLPRPQARGILLADPSNGARALAETEAHLKNRVQKGAAGRPFQRKKQGFWFPLDVWLDSALGSAVRESIAEFESTAGIFAVGLGESLFRQRRNSRLGIVRKRFGMLLWNLYVLAETWKGLRRFGRDLRS